MELMDICLSNNILRMSCLTEIRSRFSIGSVYCDCFSDLSLTLYVKPMAELPNYSGGGVVSWQEPRCFQRGL